jgi:hypothetical protein
LKEADFASEEETAVVALLRVAENFPDQDYRQYRRFIDKSDPVFALRAPGVEDVPAKLTGGFYTASSRDRAIIALGIARADQARMKPVVAYQIVPRNGKPDAQWAVKSGVTLTSTGASPAPAGPAGALLIKSAYWWHSLPRNDWRRSGDCASCAWRDQSGKHHLLLHAELEPGNPGVNDIGALLRRTDNAFFLVAENARIPVAVTPDSVWQNRADGGYELEIVLDPKIFAALKPGETYQLEARNGRGPRWSVSAGASISRR